MKHIKQLQKSELHSPGMYSPCSVHKQENINWQR